MPTNNAPTFRPAQADHAADIAALHADSWRRYYRGAYKDSFLDGDVVSDRRKVWSSRLSDPSNSATILAEDEGRLVGFVHVVFDEDLEWGSLVDNLHVVHDRRRTGIGAQLLGCSARVVAGRATDDAMHLWVLEQNVAAQHFYRACGATCVATAPVPPPGGDPARLNGTPNGLRMAWPSAERLGHLAPPADRIRP